MYTLLLAYLPICLFAYLPICLFAYLPTYLLTYLPTYLLTYLPTYLLTYLPTYLLTYLPTYLLTYFVYDSEFFSLFTPFRTNLEYLITTHFILFYSYPCTGVINPHFTHSI